MLAPPTYCAQQFAVRANEDAEVDARLDVRDARYGGNLFDPCVVENACGCSVCNARSLRRSPSSSDAAARSSPARVLRPRPNTCISLKKSSALKRAEHVALQAEPKRHHRHDHRHADDDAHRRQDRAQFRLAQVPQREMKKELRFEGLQFILILKSVILSKTFTASTFQSARLPVTTSAPAARSASSPTVFVTPSVRIPAARAD